MAPAVSDRAVYQLALLAARLVRENVLVTATPEELWDAVLPTHREVGRATSPRAARRLSPRVTWWNRFDVSCATQPERWYAVLARCPQPLAPVADLAPYWEGSWTRMSPLARKLLSHEAALRASRKEERCNT
jgi:hypothetical protein